MKKVAIVVWTSLSGQGDTQGAEGVDIFLKMYERNFHNEIANQAKQGKSDKANAKVPKILKDKDVKKFNSGLLEDIETAYYDLLNNPTKAKYTKLQKLIQVYLTCYNRKRAGVSQITNFILIIWV